MDFLVGYTGFVGSNILNKHAFSGLYNSKNIEEAYGKNPDLLVYSGVPAEMFLANKFPEKDRALMDEAIENIKKINPKKLVLISSISVLSSHKSKDEEEEIDKESLLPYGKNRRYLEEWVIQNVEYYHIVRLPALFGDNIKKNFIYDFIHLIPPMLNEAKYEEQRSKNADIEKYYTAGEDGFYRLNKLSPEEKKKLRDYYAVNDFNALKFTDSRSRYQFYNLKNLWHDIETTISNDLKILNLMTEPVSVGELYSTLMKDEVCRGKVTDVEFVNELNKEPFDYDCHTKYDNLFYGKNGYIADKYEVINSIREFVVKEIEKHYS